MQSANGFDNVLWTMGIVENVNDVAQIGRAQVRCFGIHPPATTEEVQTEDLPWAPVLNAGHGGTVLPTKGDWVVVAFMDGRDAQHPFVFGIVAGVNNQLPTSSGSSDPYTAPSKEGFDNYGQPAMPKPQGGEDLETTQIALQNASLLELPPASDATGVTEGRPIREPEVPFATQPHKNAVWKSRNSDSFVQVMESGGNENIVISHNSGSHIQIDSAGNVKLKSFGDMYMLSEGHTYEGGRGAKTLTVEGPYNLLCKNATIEIQGDMKQTVGGDYTLNVGGKFSISTGQSLDLAAQRISMESVSEHFNIKSAQKIRVASGDSTTISSEEKIIANSGSTMVLKSSEKLNIESNAKVDVIGSSGINLDGNPLHLNSGESSAADQISSVDMPSSPNVTQPVTQKVSSTSTPVKTSIRAIGAGSIDDQEI